jgi:hypothetical protein
MDRNKIRPTTYAADCKHKPNRNPSIIFGDEYSDEWMDKTRHTLHSHLSVMLSVRKEIVSNNDN